MCLLTAVAGCHSGRTPVAATSSVEATPTTEAMVGRWGTNGNESLIITKHGERITIACPANDTWRMDVHDAAVAGNEIRFVEKNYLRSGEDHPFNGIACNCVAKLVGDRKDQSEFGMTTVHSPGHESEILTRLN